MLIKPKKLVLVLSCTAIGAIYFVAFAGLDVNPVLKQQLILLPVQIGVLAYLLWWRRQKSAPPSSDAIDSKEDPPK